MAHESKIKRRRKENVNQQRGIMRCQRELCVNKKPHALALWPSTGTALDPSCRRGRHHRWLDQTYPVNV